MKKVRITVMRKASYPDLSEQYENPLDNPCDMELGQVWIANGWEKPRDFCESAWQSISPSWKSSTVGTTRQLQRPEGSCG